MAHKNELDLRASRHTVWSSFGSGIFYLSSHTRAISRVTVANTRTIFVRHCFGERPIQENQPDFMAIGGLIMPGWCNCRPRQTGEGVTQYLS